jgi:hypothetical protein
MLRQLRKWKSGRTSSSRPADAGVMTPTEDQAEPSASMAMRLAESARGQPADGLSHHACPGLALRRSRWTAACTLGELT